MDFRPPAGCTSPNRLRRRADHGTLGFDRNRTRLESFPGLGSSQSRSRRQIWRQKNQGLVPVCLFQGPEGSKVQAAQALLEEILKAKAKAAPNPETGAEALHLFETTSVPDEPLSAIDEAGDDDEVAQAAVPGKGKTLQDPYRPADAFFD